MTDARLPDRWLNDRRLQRLSPEHFRAYINALMWSVANRTDGVITREDLGLTPHWCAHSAKAFVDAELFIPRSDGWLIADFATTQTARSELELLERHRARERQKKARQREKKAQEASGSDDEGGGVTPLDEDDDFEQVTPPVPGDVPWDASPGTAQEGRQAGRKALKEGKSHTGANGWPQWRGAGADPFWEHA